MKNIVIKATYLCLTLSAIGFVSCTKLPDEKLTHKSNPDYPYGSNYTLEYIQDVQGKWGNVRAYKDLSFDSLFIRDYGWNGGDGVYSTLLPDGNTFWSFGDSFFGKLIDAEKRIRGGNESNFPRNAVAIQTGSKHEDLVFINKLVQTNDPTKNTYYKGKTFLRHPDAALTQQQIDNGEVDADKFYWAGDAVVCNTDPGAPILQVIWGAMKPVAGGEGTERFETAYSSYSLKGKLGDAEYMKLLEFEPNFRPLTTNYGSTIWKDEDGHLYLYGAIENSPVIARTKTHDLRSQWEYYIKKDASSMFTWQTELPTEEQMKLSKIVSGGQWASQPTIMYIDGVYYMIAQEGGFGREIYVWRSNKPWGPFNDRKVIFYVPDTVNKLGSKKYGHTYNSFVHRQFSRQGELLLSMNMDAPNFFEDNFGKEGSADFYKPYFFRLFNWLSVYDESK